VRAAQNRKARLAMTCSKCGRETRHYRIVAHKFLRDRIGRLIGVENVPVCNKCLEKGVNENGTNSKSSNE
jgi:hypothetical protein